MLFKNSNVYTPHLGMSAWGTVSLRYRTGHALCNVFLSAWLLEGRGRQRSTLYSEIVGLLDIRVFSAALCL